MKYIHQIMLFSVASLVYAAPPSNKGYTLIWSDEFDSNALDLNNWSYETGIFPPFSSVDPAYNTEGLNMTLENGSAVLWAKHENYNGRNYTSCRINTKANKEFQYGYFEVSLKAPEGKGLWPSFLTLGSNYYTSVGWPVCGQIDIFSTLTGPDQYGGLGDEAFMGTCYYEGEGGVASYHSLKYQYTEKLSLQYHLYAIEWDSLGVSYYFDDEKFWEYDTINENYNFTSFHQPHFFTAEIHVGGNYQGNYIDTTIFPQAMYIDYVRVYQKTTQVRESPRNNIFNNIVLVNPAAAYFKLYDMRGRLISDFSGMFRSMKKGERFSINSAVSTLPQGVYLARIFNGMNAISQKLVVRK